MILFICTGNTCRSPLAEAIAKSHGINALSAGLFADAGTSASKKAKMEAEMRGLSLHEHKAQQVSYEMVEKASVIYAMNESLVQLLRGMFPQHADKINAIVPEIEDPFGKGQDAYTEAADQLEDFIMNLQHNL